MKEQEDIVVFIISGEAKCSECGENLGTKAWITHTKDKEVLCLACADLAHLEFLPSGDAAVTRRARKHSTLSAVILKWHRKRKHYERQGVLIEKEALEKAEKDCLADHEARERRRKRAAARRAELDQKYIKQFAQYIRKLYPGCSIGTEFSIAEHACEKYSGRIGRSRVAKSFDEQAITLAVIAHIRHAETEYDSLIAMGYDRFDAREQVRDRIDEILAKWEKVGMLPTGK